MPPNLWEKWEQRHSGAGYQLGVLGKCTLLLDAPAVVGRGEYLILVIEVVAAHPQPGQSLPLHHGWALLYACLPTCLLAAAGRCSKIKILTATRSISLCSFIYR